MANTEKNSGKAPKQRSWDWRSYFPVVILKQGEMDEERGVVEDFRMLGSRKGASAKVRDFDCSVEVPSTYLECEEYLPWQKGFSKRENYGYGFVPVRDETNLRPDRRFSCNCTNGLNKNFCRHVAALLIHWEKTLGKFTFVETEEDIRLRAEKAAEAERKRREQEEEDRKRRKEEEERLRQRQEMETKQKDVSPARNFYGNRMPRAEADVHFNPETILKDVTTDRYELEIAEKLQAKAASSAESSPETMANAISSTDSSTQTTANAASSAESSPEAITNAAPQVTEMKVSFNESGRQLLHLFGKCADERVTLDMTGTAFEEIHCTCGRCHNYVSPTYSWHPRPALLCAHALLVFEEGWRRIVAEKPGDETDQKAETLLTLLADGAADFEEETVAEVRSAKKAEITLTPKITEDKRNGKLQLSFQIGRLGERLYALRNL